MPTYRLKADHNTRDRRLDRIPQFDERSRQFPIRSLIGDVLLKPKRWTCLPRIDQGQEGSCVGHGWAHELAAEPVRVPGVTHATALAIYHRAQQLDEWPGEAYEGTSVLAGAKAVQEQGHMAEFRWAFGVEDVLATLSAHGPVVIGVDWHEGCMRTDAHGYITPTGSIVGGHCTLLRGILRERGQWVCIGRNSWGRDWGAGGDFKITATDLAQLLDNAGEACVPVVRT
jgi:hypothetical protein